MTPRAAVPAAERARVAALAAGLERCGAAGCRLAIVLGSGLGGPVRRVEGQRTLPFRVLEGMPQSSVPGHAGRFVVGTLAGLRVVVQEGRVHAYEGRTAAAVTRSMRAFAALGIEGVLLTNSAGSLRPEWGPGTLVRLVDQIDLQGRASLARGEHVRGSPYRPIAGEPDRGAWMDEAARATGIELQHGVYVGLQGPAYETPAEIRALARLGADLVGMSTVAEAAVAAACGLRPVAVSCVSNLAAGLARAALDHDEVLRAGEASSERLAALCEAFARGLAAR